MSFMEKLKRFEKNTLITLLAFAMPALLMLFIFVIGDFAPFGKVSILVADMQYQFVDYIGYMKSVFFGDNDLLYSFSKTFGGDMSGFASYYLNNPFFLLLMFFPNDILPQGIVIMMILICGFTGLFFHLMLRGIWGNRFSSVIFSTCYAMMGFMMAYINCIHYFFSVMLLPLVILGLYKIMVNRKMSVVYVAAVAASVISCYYIGYMILIFTAVFFVCALFSDVIPFKDMRDRLKTAWIVLYSTVIGVGISAFSLIAVLMSLKGQKSSGLQLSLVRTFNILEFFSGLYTGSFKGNISDGLPIIYSGIVPVVFLFFYFANSHVKIKEKIFATILFAFMGLGFWIDALNVAWHGFAHPIGFPYRNSFLFSFLVIFFGYKGFVAIKEGFRKRTANIFVVLFALYSAYLLRIGSNYVGAKSVIITGLSMCIILICVVAMGEKNRYIIPALAGFFFISAGELLYNGAVSVDAYFEEKTSDYNSMATFKEYVDDTSDLVSFVESHDDGFYRMDKLFRRTHNDPMMFSYNGLSHFSSCETEQVKTFMGRLGYRNNKNWAFYGDASTSFSDSFMGLKYLLSQYDETSKPYAHYYSIKDKYIYKNPYALSLGFGMKDKVKSIDMEEPNPFELQNNIASDFSGTKYVIYRPVRHVDVNLCNVINEDKIYRKENPSEEAYVEYVLNITGDDFIYMYFDAPAIQNTTLTINGDDKGQYFNEYDWSVRECGYFKPGEKVSVRFYLNQDEIEIDNAYFYYESSDVLRMWYKEASSSSCNIEKISSSHLMADVNMSDDADLLVFSIPYEKDWTVKIDGQKVTPIRVMDALMAIKVAPGEHNIELKYFPRGLAMGIPISIVSLIVFAGLIYIGKKKSRENTI